MSEPARLCGIHIANGYSSEAAVFARLLGSRPEDAYEPTVLFHESSSSKSDADTFERVAQCDVVRYDTGWRSNTDGVRLSPSRLTVVTRYLLRSPAVVRVVHRHCPTVVYSGQQHYDCRAATLAARTLRVPQILHLHYNIGPWLKRPVLRRLRTCDQVIAISDYIREDALRHGVPPERVTTIKNAIEVGPPIDAELARAARRDLGVPDDAYVVGMVSRLDPSKGHLDAIAAFSTFAHARADAWLVIVGSGTDAARIREHAERSAVHDRIVLAGRRENVPELLASFDAFLHPSRHEPFGLAILEAMASSLPTIAYEEGGVPEIITPGTGILVPPSDVAALAEALGTLHDDPSAAIALGEAGRQRVVTAFRPSDAAHAFADVVRLVSGAGGE